VEQQAAMRILIRDKQTGKYLSGSDMWTDYRDEAADFQHCDRAIDMAREKGLKGVEILLDFGEPQYDIRLPFQEFPGGLTPTDHSRPTAGPPRG
jgi:hypothetical protein